MKGLGGQPRNEQTGLQVAGTRQSRISNAGLGFHATGFTVTDEKELHPETLVRSPRATPFWRPLGQTERNSWNSKSAAAARNRAAMPRAGSLAR